jgi:hypothetical protein
MNKSRIAALFRWPLFRIPNGNVGTDIKFSHLGPDSAMVIDAGSGSGNPQPLAR